MHILALDVGVGSVRAAVLDVAKAQPLASVSRTAYALDHPTPDAAEVPAERLWQAVTAAAREAVWRAGASQPLAGIGLACLTPALVLLDKADRPLTPIWTPLDRRGRAAARQTWACAGEEFLRTVGSRPLPGGVSVLSWKQQVEDDPYLTHHTRSYLHVNGWLALRLTGERAFDPANASLSGLYGTLTDQTWSRRWCEYFELDGACLPPVVCGSTTLGTVRAAAAAELGVPAGLPVKLGTDDVSSAVLAAGMGPGDLLHLDGATQTLAALTDHPQPAPQRLTRRLGVGRQFLHETCNPVGGLALDWLHGLCFRDQTAAEFYERTIPAVRDRQTRVTLDPAFVGGDRLEIEAHRAAFRDLTLATDRLDLLAALLEAMRRKHREALAALGLGERFGRIFLAGERAAVVQQLLPGYAGAVQRLEEGSLRGMARLFRQ
jgi:sugar (pentulose or hexulose) kinase